MFCAPGHVFGGAECVGSRFHVLRSRTHFRRCGGCRVPFSCFALTDSFLVVPSASSPVFIFCAPGLLFDGTEGVGSRFDVFTSRARFRRYKGRQDLFSYFSLPDSFLAVPRASAPIFMFCTAGHVFGGAEGVGSHFHVLHARTHFRRCGWRRVPLTSFALPNTFSAVRSASGRVIMFCAPNTFSAVRRASDLVIMFCAPEHVFSGVEGVGSRFHVLRSRSHFPRYRGIRDPFSYFALLDSFLAVLRATGPVFDSTEVVGSCLHILRSRTHFRRYRVRCVPF
jgi:hypothetical protein